MPLTGLAQTERTVTYQMQTEPPDYHAWITQLSIGKLTRDKAVGESISYRRYRVAVLTSEIFNTVVVERVSYGREGGDAHVDWARRVALYPFNQTFGLRGTAISGLVVGPWAGPNAFEFTVQARRFVATITSDSTIAVHEKRDDGHADLQQNANSLRMEITLFGGGGLTPTALVDTEEPIHDETETSPVMTSGPPFDSGRCAHMLTWRGSCNR